MPLQNTAQVQQLVGLLATAPQHLWVELLEQILDLLDSSRTPAGVASTMQLMHFLTINDNTIDGDTTTTPISPELCMRLRLALSHTLADSFATAAH